LLARDAVALDLAQAAVGRALTAAGDPAGLAIWDGMSAGMDNLAAQERRLRAGIAQQDWARVVAWVQRMPALTEKRDRWLYWLGYAQSALGDERAARATFAQAAAARSLWGLLAADRLGLPYALEPRPAPAEPERIQRLAGAPAMVRMRLLRVLGREADMRREWRTLTRSLERPDLLAAAYVADALRWHDQAIFTLARTDYWDDLELRFPLAYRDLVDGQAQQTGLPTEWIYGVIRQESVFNATVASPVGALGLMQLMPATARQVAADLGLTPPTPATILDPGLNLRLGSRYLAQLQGRFGHAALVTAAYNAGPERVARWLPDACTPAALWIAAIAYDETRGYVERVLAYRIIYRARLGLAPGRLSDLLPPVCPPGRV
jgi:soluble lytic murein transglycosylase